jgi:hypothetical protein
LSTKDVLRGTIVVAVAIGVGLVAWAAQPSGFNLGSG